MRDHEFLLAKLLAKNAKAIGRSFLDSVITSATIRVPNTPAIVSEHGFKLKLSICIANKIPNRWPFLKVKV